MASPTQSRKSFLRTVGEGLAPPVVSWDYFRIHRRGGYQPPEPSPLEGKGAEQSEADEGGLRNGTPSAGRPVSGPYKKKGQLLYPPQGRHTGPPVSIIGGSSKGLPCRKSKRCAQGPMSLSARAE